MTSKRNRLKYWERMDVFRYHTMLLEKATDPRFLSFQFQVRSTAGFTAGVAIMLAQRDVCGAQ